MNDGSIEVIAANPNCPQTEECRLVTELLTRGALNLAALFGQAVVLDALVSIHVSLAVSWAGKEAAARALEKAKASLDKVELMQREDVGHA